MPVNFLDPTTANTEIQESKNPNKHTKKNPNTRGVYRVAELLLHLGHNICEGNL
jgi:hypothetical protein